jgi:heterodisulfide reductase subunit A
MELEYLISSTGPTEGKALMKNGEAAKKFAIIHCVGSRTETERNYCSGICCMEGLKINHLLKHKGDAGVSATHFFLDWCLPGNSGQAFYNKVAAEAGSKFIRVDGISSLAVKRNSGGKLTISYKDASGGKGADDFDMAVLLPAVIPGKESAKLSAMFQAALDDNGFFKEAHNRISQVATNMEGVYVAGFASGPVDIAGATSAGKAAAGEILSKLVPGEKLELEAITASINDDVCTGCKVCISMCPFKAVSFDAESGKASVNEVLCRGCGTCVGACPSGAAAGRNFTVKQIFAEIEGVLA